MDTGVVHEVIRKVVLYTDTFLHPFAFADRLNLEPEEVVAKGQGKHFQRSLPNFGIGLTSNNDKTPISWGCKVQLNMK